MERSRNNLPLIRPRPSISTLVYRPKDADHTFLIDPGVDLVSLPNASVDSGRHGANLTKV
ncbi:hypothetical protein PAXRUDRAFT_834260 [Paxillus rubicundulus Ve08.2h10]|uniref:Uncharacterized protein n=1 Tax=Paxillus rubicundulus Ve08.2h10 TaxID=930991 RepID=A0A0D0D638_9AGAM|nr:hypothetical protein PAXRUDRAFT_834260 [Paxillus rubicundulus Ve08.2h10]